MNFSLISQLQFSVSKIQMRLEKIYNINGRKFLV